MYQLRFLNGDHYILTNLSKQRIYWEDIRKVTGLKEGLKSRHKTYEKLDSSESLGSRKYSVAPGTGAVMSQPQSLTAFHHSAHNSNSRWRISNWIFLTIRVYLWEEQHFQMETHVLLPKATEMDAEQPKKQNKTNTAVHLHFSVTLNKTLDIVSFT